MLTATPYLNFPGTSEEAFKFYQTVFGGELTMNRFKDTPEASRVPKDELDKMMHIALMHGSTPFLMATDTLESMGHRVSPGTNIHLSVNTRSEDETRTIFNALSTSGTVTIPLAMQFWGDYFGMLTDKFGIQWMVSFAANRN